jgi:hypothetical protein
MARRIVSLLQSLSWPRSSAELPGRLEVGLLVAHLIAPPSLAAPASVPVLETFDGRTVSAQDVDEKDRRSLQQWV